MKNQDNDTYSLAQGKYPWGLNQNLKNSKFVIKVGKEFVSFQLFYVNTMIMFEWRVINI